MWTALAGAIFLAEDMSLRLKRICPHGAQGSCCVLWKRVMLPSPAPLHAPNDCKGGARMRPLPSQFDPTNPGHRTTDEWAMADPVGWFQSAFTYALAHGEARVLLRAGVVLVLWWDAHACIVHVEEL